MKRFYLNFRLKNKHFGIRAIDPPADSKAKGWVYDYTDYENVPLKYPAYSDHVLVLKLIPEEIKMLCDLSGDSVPAVNYLNVKYPDLNMVAV